MRKYMLRYLLLWLPAAAVALFYNHATTLSQALQWIFAGVMVLGWAANTGMCAYHYPRTTLSLILFYTGMSIFSITMQVSVRYGSQLYDAVHRWGGLLSFRPLDILVVALLDFRIPQEAYVVGFLVLLCLTGYLVGLLYRRIRPNPYRPRVMH